MGKINAKLKFKHFIYISKFVTGTCCDNTLSEDQEQIEWSSSLIYCAVAGFNNNSNWKISRRNSISFHCLPSIWNSSQQDQKVQKEHTKKKQH